MDPLARSEHFVPLEHGRLYYTRSGRGAPLLFLHSNGTSGRYWEPHLPRLARHFACYNVDTIGWGRSDVPSRPYSLDELSSCVALVMHDAGLERASICGTHAGALLALCFAARRPERVDKLILDGLPFYDRAAGEAFYEAAILPPMTDTTSFDRPVHPRFTWEQARDRDPVSYASGAGMTREEWERGHELREQRRYWQRLSYDEILGCDVTALVADLRAPVLLTAGSGDLLHDFAAPAHAAIPGSRLEIMPTSAGTSAPTGAPDAFFAAVMAFLQPDSPG